MNGKEQMTEEQKNRSEIDKKDYESFLMGDLSGFERLVLRYKNSLIYFINRYIKYINMS